MTGQKIMWLLDVDGVLNAVNVLDELAKWEKKKAEGGCWSDYTSGTATDRRTFGIIWSPQLGERIIAVHNSGYVDIRWLTTWEANAQKEIAPLLGLPHFAVADGPNHYEVTEGPFGWWKLPRAQQNAQDECPLIWTDDDLRTSRAAEKWAGERSGPSMLVTPRWDVGISPKQMDAIEDFIAEHHA